MSFAEVLAVVANKRLPLDIGASQTLSVMLERDDPCDARITPSEFTMAFGSNPGPHLYTLRVAPATLSGLLDGIIVGPPRIRAKLAPRRIPFTQGYPAWKFGPRTLWLDVHDDEVVIAIRANAPITDAFPPSIVPRWFETVDVDFGPPLPCPRCLLPGTRYRSISDRALVCRACGRSFPKP